MTTDALDTTDRGHLLARLTERTFDVVLVGAGITGAGIARDLALRGVEVALLEADDFASGTSSRSTKLVHGGLRYLAQGDVGLVREAASERAIVQRIAPHLAIARQVIVPARSRLQLTKLRAGLWSYEKLGGVESDERHEVWDRAALTAKEPCLRSATWAGAVVYSEYLTDDARLTIANLRSAHAAGAVVANYLPVTALVIEQGRVVGVSARDALRAESAAAANAADIAVRGRVVVNATGPWADTLRQLESTAAPPRLMLTKGIHLVFPREALPLERMAIVDGPDGRGVFLVPRGEFVYTGTTDTFYPSAEHWPRIEAADVDYVLETIAANCHVQLGRADVQGCWAGIRPLIGEANKRPSEISRKDELMQGPAGLVTIAGGKLTAFRRMAERVADVCEHRLGRQPTPTRTHTEPLPGAIDVQALEVLRAQLASTHGAIVAERLTRLYGGEAASIAAAPDIVAAEAQHALANEGAVRLADWWVRRSARAWFERDTGSLQRAADVFATRLCWSSSERDAQIADCASLGALPPV